MVHFSGNFRSHYGAFANKQSAAPTLTNTLKMSSAVEVLFFTGSATDELVRSQCRAVGDHLKASEGCTSGRFECRPL